MDDDPARDDLSRDDLGFAVPLPAGGVRRVVSLVPSLTESLAATDAGVLVGATDWCTHPAGLDVVRLRGTKNPDVEAIVNLRPDLVLANVEENRSVDVGVLRAAGIPVWVTDVRTVPGAVRSLARMLAAIGLPRPGWLDDVEAAWAGVPAVFEPRRRAVVPIWRRPWMAIGRDTFTGDVLARLGVDNALAAAQERYPKIDLTDLPEHDLVVLPDEPYAFSCDDGPEAFPGTPCTAVSGRHLTWYGPSLAEAPDVLRAQLSKECSGAGNSPERTSSA